MPKEGSLSEVKEHVLRWRQSLPASMPIADLIARNPIAHRWKAPLRSLVLRETLHRRMVDLLEQTIILLDHRGILGARILLRCAIETIAVLVYTNQKMSALLEGSLTWVEFDSLTTKLLL